MREGVEEAMKNYPGRRSVVPYTISAALFHFDVGVLLPRQFPFTEPTQEDTTRKA